MEDLKTPKGNFENNWPLGCDFLVLGSWTPLLSFVIYLGLRMHHFQKQCLLRDQSRTQVSGTCLELSNTSFMHDLLLVTLMTEIWDLWWSLWATAAAISTKVINNKYCIHWKRINLKSYQDSLKICFPMRRHLLNNVLRLWAGIFLLNI